MKVWISKGLPILLVMLLLAGCRNITASYGMKAEQTNGLHEQILALERQNQALKDRTARIAEQADILRQSLNEGRLILQDRQQTLEETRNQMEQYQQDIEDSKDGIDQIIDVLYSDFLYRYSLFLYEMDLDRVTDIGARAEMAMLMAVTGEEGSLTVTMDPVVWTGNGEKGDWTFNESTDDIRTLSVAEETFYGINGADPIPISAVQLREKLADPYPPPFVFYVLDEKVYMIAEQYIP